MAAPRERLTSTRWFPWLRIVGIIGALFVLFSLTSKSVGDFVFGLLLVGVQWWFRLRDRRIHAADRSAALVLGDALRRGEWPATVQPTGLAEYGVSLAPGERCFLDAVPVEALTWYGDPVTLQNRVVLAWGGPMAWILSAVGTFAFWSYDRKQRQKATPRWRDPDPGLLWLTDRAFVLHGRKGMKSWLRWDFQTSIQQSWVDPDGLVLMLAQDPPVPVKLRFESATWSYVLYRFITSGDVYRPGQSVPVAVKPPVVGGPML